MKRLTAIALAGLMFLAISCEDKKHENTEVKTNDKEAKNIAAFETVNRAFETGDVSHIDSVVAEDFLDHTDRGDKRGRDSLKAMVTMMHEMMKDAKTEVIQSVAKGDYVYGWMRYTGTSNGEMGMPKGPYDMQAIELVKFNNDNKAIEHWAFMEVQAMMKMMPPPPPPSN